MKNNGKSDTKELDSILEELRGNKGGSKAGGAGSSNRSSYSAPNRKPIARQDVVYLEPDDSFDDKYVITDETYTEIIPTKRKASSAKKAQAQPEDMPKKKKGKGALIAVLIIVGVLIIAGAAGVTMYLNSGSDTGPESTFSDNVKVNGISLKDMTMDDARKAMSAVEQDLANGIKVTVKAGDQTFDYGKDAFKYSFDTDKVLAQAKAYSEEKGIKTEDKNYEITMTVDPGNCEQIIKTIAEKVDTEAKNAEVTEFDPDADDMFTFAAEKKGIAVDKEKSLNALTTFIKSGKVSGTVDAEVSEVDPEYTESYLKENIVKLSSYSTYSTNNSNGNNNMRVSLDACNGSIIEPGATWSFNDCTGDSNLESNGYLPAGVIIQGRSETGVGGGICQSSTTIYNAAILCGMDVEERACHYYKSTYVDAGRDATIDYGNIDLKVSNPFDYQLFMKCWMDGTELNCEIYGLENPKFDEIEISTTDPSYFSNGYTVYSTRYYYKNGEEVDSDDLPSSTYYTSAPSSGGSSSNNNDYSNDDNSDSDDSQGGDEAPADNGNADNGGDNGGADNGGGEAPAENNAQGEQ